MMWISLNVLNTNVIPFVLKVKFGYNLMVLIKMFVVETFRSLVTGCLVDRLHITSKFIYETSLFLISAHKSLVLVVPYKTNNCTTFQYPFLTIIFLIISLLIIVHQCTG